MRRYLPLLLIGLACGRTTVAIFDFENNGLEPYEVRQLSTRLESELVIVNKYNVVERSKIDEILKEQKLQMSGCVEECLIEIGNMIGAKKVILGSVGIMGKNYTSSARLVNAETGEILKSANYDTQSLGDLLSFGMKYTAGTLCDLNITLPKNKMSKTNTLDERQKKIERRELEDYAVERIYSKSLDEVLDNIADELYAEEYRQGAIQRTLENYPDIEQGKDWWSIDNQKPKVEFIAYHDPPRALTPINPEYPIIAEQKGIIGTVFLQALIDEFGYVNAIIVFRGIPNSGLNEAAMDAVRKTRYKPAKRREKAVDAWITVPVSF